MGGATPYNVVAEAEAVALAFERRTYSSPQRRRSALLVSLFTWGGLAVLFTLALAFLAMTIWLAELAVRVMLG